MENQDIGPAAPSPTSPGQPDAGATLPTPVDRTQIEETVPMPATPSLEDEDGQEGHAAQDAGQADEPLPSPEQVSPAPELPLESSAPPPPQPPPAKKRRVPWPAWMLIGLLSLALIALASGYGGYQNGIQLRTAAQETQIASQLDEQFDLAVRDMSAGRYELAYQRLTYINDHNPNYPGLIDLLVEVQLKVSTTPTPTLAPTPTLTPTPDMRGVEAMVTRAQQAIANSEWTTAIDTLLSLRKTDPQYQAITIDNLLYVAYRNRGRDKILKEADLEGGIYDLTLAQRIGPLDVEADGLLDWAGLYITGASFWEIDWAQAVYYFGQVAPALPNLRDGTGMTASERYWRALVGYGDQLMDADDPCAAVTQYEEALRYGADVAGQVEQAYASCAGDQGEEDEEGGEETEATPTAPLVP